MRNSYPSHSGRAPAAGARGKPGAPIPAAHMKRRRVCYFCVEKKLPNYKDTPFLSRYISDRGKILPRRNTGCCAKHQRFLAQAIKRVRNLALLPYLIS